MADELLTVPEVAERLRMTAMTIYRWIEDGKLPAIQVGKHYRIRAADVDDMLDRSRVGAGRDDPWGAAPPSSPSVE
jgi:excisionase family DNA binding protein